MGRDVLLNPTDDAAFRADGYVVVDLFEPDEADAILERMRNLQPDDGFHPRDDGPNLANYHCTFLDTSDRYKAALAATVDELFAAPLGALLPGHRLLASNLYVKQPGTGRFEVHQNWQTTADLNDVTVTAWCPLVDVSTENGTICVVPGSHELVPAIEAVTTPKYYERFYDHLIDDWLVPIPMRRGQLLLFDDTLLHWSDDNRGDLPRWAVQIDLIPVTADPTVYWLNTSAAQPRFEVFHADSDFWRESGVATLRDGPHHLPSRGLRPYSDPRIDEDDFVYLMRHGAEMHRRYFAGELLEDLFAEMMAGAPSASRTSTPAG